jgi:hypothetical protein
MMPQADPGFEVTDRELDRGVAAVVGVQPDRGADSVGHKCVVAPGGEELGLGADQVGAAHDQPVALIASLGELRQAPVGVDDVDPGVLVDRLNRGSDPLGLPHGDRGADLVAAAGPDGLGRPEPRIGAQGQLAAGARAAHPGGQFVDEPCGAAGGVARPVRWRACSTSPLSARVASSGC